MELVVSILSSAVTSAALTTVLVFLARSWIGERLASAIRHEYDLKMERFRAQLQSETQSEVEKLKAQLQITTATHQIQFTSLHARTAEAVAEVYARIVRVKNAASKYVKVMESSNDSSKEERRKILAGALGEFHDYYGTHRLYLTEESTKIIDQFDRTVFGAAQEFMWCVEKPLAQGEPHDLGVWNKSHQAIVETVPTLLSNLEGEFRRLLGRPNTS
jgi:hypothetical protein